MIGRPKRPRLLMWLLRFALVSSLVTSSLAFLTSTSTTLITTSSCQSKTSRPIFSINSHQDLDDEATYFSPNVPLDNNRNDKSEDDLPGSPSNSSSTNEYSFFDEAIIYVRAGSGGQGSSTFKKVAGQDGPPDGGNGGLGGNVRIEVDPSLNTLAGLTHAWRPNSWGGSGGAVVQHRPKSFRAEHGADGERQFKNGRFGKEVTIRVPPGTVVQEILHYDPNNGLEQQEETLINMGTISSQYQESLVVARGGQGGEGTGVQSKSRGVRRTRLAPTGGERKWLKLTLQIVADVALVGVPNAGKSTFLASVTRAKPKIANYPFTTVIPNLGVWVPSQDSSKNYNPHEYEPYHDKLETRGAGSNGLVLCDVPGLIAGAAQGVGLGHAFLRHVERCHIILHLVDATSNDPIADYEMLNREIVKYGTGQLAKMPQVVVVNKVDAYLEDSTDSHEGSTEDWEKGLKVRLKRKELETRLKQVMPHTRLMWMSAKERDGVDDLMSRLAAFVTKVKGSVDSQ